VTATCPNGHVSEADDFCDTCGAKIDPSRQLPTSGEPKGHAQGSAPSPEQICPNCQTANAVDALFCEACGYDFTTGALPRGAVREAPPQGPGHGSPGGSLSLDPTPGGESAGSDGGSGRAEGLGGEGADGTGSQSQTPEGDASRGDGVGVAAPEGEASGGGASGAGASGAGASQGEASEGEASEGGTPGGSSRQGGAEPQAPDGGGAPARLREAAGAPVGGGGNVAPAILLEWVAEIWVDPDWYAGQEAEEPMPSPGLPSVVPLRHRSALIGRVSTSRNITPDIDCTSDTGVSRRHAQLSTDGRRWFVEDLGSSNGTFIGPASGPLPENPIAVGPRTELDGDDRIYVGAWTRIVVRSATEDEVAAQAE